MTKLEEDIVKKFTSRLKQACRDHVTLCEIAEISPADGASMLLAAIGAFLAEAIATTTRMSPEDFGETMAQAVRLNRAKEANE